MPADLARAIRGDRKAAAAWEALSYTNKKEMALGIDGAKRPETRERRLSQAIESLRSK